MPKYVRNISNSNMSVFKSILDIFLKTIEDTPGVPNISNSLSDLIKETVRGGYGVLLDYRLFAMRVCSFFNCTL